MSDFVELVESHPGLMDQEKIDEEVQSNPYFPDQEMSVDDYYEWSTSTVAETDEWHIFRHKLTSGHVFVWNKMIGYGFRVLDEEGCWQNLVEAFSQVDANRTTGEGE